MQIWLHKSLLDFFYLVFVFYLWQIEQGLKMRCDPCYSFPPLCGLWWDQCMKFVCNLPPHFKVFYKQIMWPWTSCMYQEMLLALNMHSSWVWSYIVSSVAQYSTVQHTVTWGGQENVGLTILVRYSNLPTRLSTDWITLRTQKRIYHRVIVQTS